MGVRATLNRCSPSALLKRARRGIPLGKEAEVRCNIKIVISLSNRRKTCEQTCRHVHEQNMLVLGFQLPSFRETMHAICHRFVQEIGIIHEFAKNLAEFSFSNFVSIIMSHCDLKRNGK